MPQLPVIPYGGMVSADAAAQLQAILDASTAAIVAATAQTTLAVTAASTITASSTAIGAAAQSAQDVVNAVAAAAQTNIAAKTAAFNAGVSSAASNSAAATAQAAQAASSATQAVASASTAASGATSSQTAATASSGSAAAAASSASTALTAASTATQAAAAAAAAPAGGGTGGVTAGYVSTAITANNANTVLTGVTRVNNLKGSSASLTLGTSAGDVALLVAAPAAVNFVNIASQATGGAPSIYPSGPDANIALYLAAKGTQTVYAGSRVQAAAGLDVTGTSSFSVAPTMPTAALGDNTTSAATTAFVARAVSGGVGAGGAGSALVVFLSKSGITSDAPNGLEWGATAPSGTGQEAAINALIASSYAAAAALGVAGVKLVWDVACTLSGPVFLRSNMTVEAANYGCGAIMRAGANSPVFMVDGMQADMGNGAYTVAGVPNLATQKTFGKFDPAYSGSANPQFNRVFDAAFVNAKALVILGGTWNGYYAGQVTQPPGTQAGLPFIVRLNIGYNSIMHFFGVDGLTLRGVRGFNGTHFGLNLCNVGNVLLEECDIDQLQDRNYGSDAFHFGGPISNMRIINPRTHCADDNLAFNADDYADGPPPTPLEGLKCGVNWQCSGAIVDVLVQNFQVWNGRENVIGWGAICFRSQIARIDRIVIDGVHGTTSNWAIWAPENNGNLFSGPGNIGHITLRDVDMDLYQNGVPAMFYFQKNVEHLEIISRTRRSAQACPDIMIAAGCTVQRLTLDGYVAHQPAGAPNNTQPAVVVAGTVNALRMSASASRDSSITASASPLLRVAAGGTVGQALLDVDAVGITNLVENAGTIGTMMIRGMHRTAGGGSPVANTGTIASLLVGTGTMPLVWSSAVASVTGTAPVALNAYTETAAAAGAAYATLLAFTGAAGVPTGTKAVTQFNTAAAATCVLDGNGKLVFDASDAIGVLVGLGVQPDGYYRFTVAPGAPDYRIPFRSTNGASATGYIAQWQCGVAQFSVIKFTAGAFGGGVYSAAVGTMPLPVATVGFRLNGQNFNFYVDDVQVGAFVGDGTITGNGLIGVGTTSSSFSKIEYHA